MSRPTDTQTSSCWPSWPLPFGLRLPPLDGGPCPYLEGLRMRIRGFACDTLPSAAYQRLLDAGFRRSGRLFYQPACAACRRCRPLRIPVDRFRPSRSQRRCRRRNADVRVVVGAPAASEAKYRLFRRYMTARHADGQMGTDRRSYEEFLYADVGDSLELCYHLDGELVAVGLADLTPDAVSAVYAYRDPELDERGLGTFSCLTEIALAEELRRPFYYPGYWIRECRKMAYKSRFRPCEVLGTDGVWRELDPREADPESAPGDEAARRPAARDDAAVPVER